MKQTILFSLLALAITTCANAQPVKLSVESGKLAIRNYDPTRSVVAFQLEDPKGRAVTEKDIDIAPGTGRKMEMPAVGGPWYIDGALLSDGTVQGPNRFEIDKHSRMRQDLMAGKVVYPSARNYTHGDSAFYARNWAQEYRKATGREARVVYPRAETKKPNNGEGPGGGGPGDGGSDSFMLPWTFNVVGTWVPSGLAPIEWCNEVGQNAICQETFLVVNGFIPGGNPDKAEVDGSAVCEDSDLISTQTIAWSSCPGGTITVGTVLQDPGPFGTIYGTWSVLYTVGIERSGYVMNSCGPPLFISPTYVCFCDGTGCVQWNGPIPG